MDQKYRESLRQNRQKIKAAHPLVSSEWSYKSTQIETRPRVANAVEIQNKEAIKEEAPAENITTVAEKIKALDSLNVFENKPLVESNVPKSGKILEFTSVEVDSFAQRLSDKQGLQVLFITDEEFGQEQVSELAPQVFLTYFEDKIAQLFYKMTQAMRLEVEKFTITSVSVAGNSDPNRLLSEINLAKPMLIMTLGASAYQALGQSSTRLKDIHGQLIDITLKSNQVESQFKVMPIFSPKLLHTAPNMKKTTWEDMQKAMEYLKL